MRKLTFLLTVILALPAAAQAQKWDLFGGYSYMRAEEKPSDATANGWEASLGYHLNRYVSIVGAISGNYGPLFTTRMNIHGYHGGVQFSMPGSRFTPFGYLLLGDLRLSFAGLRRNVFSFVPGGGVDVSVTRRFSIRLIQADVPTGNLQSTSVDGRISTGIVFHF